MTNLNDIGMNLALRKDTWAVMSFCVLFGSWMLKGPGLISSVLYSPAVVATGVFHSKNQS